jgi:hypothetical protein
MYFEWTKNSQVVTWCVVVGNVHIICNENWIVCIWKVFELIWGQVALSGSSSTHMWHAATSYQSLYFLRHVLWLLLQVMVVISNQLIQDRVSAAFRTVFLMQGLTFLALTLLLSWACVQYFPDAVYIIFHSIVALLLFYCRYKSTVSKVVTCHIIYTVQSHKLFSCFLINIHHI